MEAKRKRRCSDDQDVPVNVLSGQEVFDQWPWALDCNSLVPSILGRPSSTQSMLGATSLPPNPARCCETVLHSLLLKRVKTRVKKKVQKKSLSENDASLKEHFKKKKKDMFSRHGFVYISKSRKECI